MDATVSEKTVDLRKLLAHISTELEIIANQNDSVQETIKNLIQNTDLSLSDIQSLQALDLLSQKKRDLGALISNLSLLISSSEAIPLSHVSSSLKLEYMKTVLIEGTPEPSQDVEVELGSVSFF